MNNLDLYNKVRTVPPEAQKPILGGRLKNMTDINPMWRIKTLTEQFGACGIGWYYDIVSERLEDGANDEKVAFVMINLYVKVDGEWSKPIVGTGGSSFVAKEKTGLYVNDECFKMALTDAISVSCKALGVGADVYWNKDRTKYDDDDKKIVEPKKEPKKDMPVVDNKKDSGNVLKCTVCGIEITQKVYDYSVDKKGVAECYACQKIVKANNEKDFQKCDEPTPF